MIIIGVTGQLVRDITSWNPAGRPASHRFWNAVWNYGLRDMPPFWPAKVPARASLVCTRSCLSPGNGAVPRHFRGGAKADPISVW